MPVTPHTGSKADLTMIQQVLQRRPSRQTAAWRRAFSASSVPGLPTIARASGFSVALWAVLLLAGIMLTGRDVYTVTAQYLNFPVLTAVTLDQAAALPFPAVTVCNLNRVHCTNLRRMAAERWGTELGARLLRLHSLTDCQLSFRRRRQANSSESPVTVDQTPTSTVDQTPPKTVDQTQAFNDLMHFMAVYANFSTELRSKMGHSFLQFIRACTFSGTSCLNNTLFFKQSSDLNYGNCFTFRTERRTVIPGREYGLSLELFLDQANYLRAGLSPQAGARVVVHETNQEPLPVENGISVSPHTATSVALLQVQILRQKSPYHANCTESWATSGYSKYVGSAYKYSSQRCQRVCLQLAFEEVCACAHPAYMDLPRGLVPCNLTSGSNAYMCATRVLDAFESRVRSCGCNMDCREVSYETRISTATWPTDTHWCSVAATLQLVKSCHPADQEYGGERRRQDKLQVQGNLLKVEVYLENLRVRSVSQTPALSAQGFVSALGGALSLYLGLSLLSLLEALGLLLQLLVRPRCPARRKRKVKLPQPIFFTGRFTPPHRPLFRSRRAW
ncbi:amiloride-sensitive sodium channel subunit alpha-like [Anabrus simplex]|uniref:amiloride-sensitive sodium channel subunit alpha-like n=1 Tax=Anabrus simplex TaxID=316456 RepID=UPI0035A3CCCF